MTKHQGDNEHKSFDSSLRRIIFHLQLLGIFSLGQDHTRPLKNSLIKSHTTR
ncbi:hypothetical protein AHAS_Ahas08G0104900 [Arachis hypogaea]